MLQVDDKRVWSWHSRESRWAAEAAVPRSGHRRADGGWCQPIRLSAIGGCKQKRKHRDRQDVHKDTRVQALPFAPSVRRTKPALARRCK